MKDICIDWCECCECAGCRFEHASDEDREKGYEEIKEMNEGN